MRSIITNIKYSMTIAISASFTLFVLRIVLKVLLLVLPFSVTFLIKLLTNALVMENIGLAIVYINEIAIIQCVSLFLGKLLTYFTSLHTDLVSRTTSHEIISIINGLDISCFDDAEFHNELANVTRDINSVSDFLWTVISIMESFVKFVLAIWMLRQIGLFYTFLIVVFSIPTLVHDKRYSFKLYEFTRDTVNEVRKRNYLFDVLTSKYFSKDLRINNLQENIKARYHKLWEEWYEKKKCILLKNIKISMPLSVLPLVSTTIVMFRIVKLITLQVMSIGDLSYGLGMVNQLVNSIQTFVSDVCIVAEKKVIIDNFMKFRNWKNNNNYALPVEEKSVDEIPFDFKSLEFANVSFKYPNTERYILRNVSFSLKKGEVVAIVGRNGCGKSTIIKLLMKLYCPTEGKIFLNGKDICNIPNNDYMKFFSVMFQDYINYCFAYKDNLHTVDIDKDLDERRVLNVSLKSGVSDFINQWKYGINTCLTKSYDVDGVEMSGGQWQKVALARMFYKKAPVYVLDEPSASLDVESEYHIFKNIYGFSNNNVTAIIITHRLKNVKFADKILVIDGGSIVEEGTHDSLIKREGEYKKMHDYENLKI